MPTNVIIVTPQGHREMKRFSDGYYYIENGQKSEKVPKEILERNRHVFGREKARPTARLCANMTRTPLHSWTSLFEIPYYYNKVGSAFARLRKELNAIRNEYQAEVFEQRARKAGQSKGTK